MLFKVQTAYTSLALQTMHCKSNEEDAQNPSSSLQSQVECTCSIYLTRKENYFCNHSLKLKKKKDFNLLIFLWPEHAPRRKDCQRMGRHGVLWSYGITSHCVRAGGITAGPGFLRHLQMATDMPCSPAASRPPLLCPQLVSSLYSPPHVESQTKRNALFVFWRCRGRNHFVV